MPLFLASACLMMSTASYTRISLQEITLYMCMCVCVCVVRGLAFRSSNRTISLLGDAPFSKNFYGNFLHPRDACEKWSVERCRFSDENRFRMDERRKHAPKLCSRFVFSFLIRLASFFLSSSFFFFFSAKSKGGYYVPLLSI